MNLLRQLRASLAERQERCSYDELRVLDVLLARLEIGRERYGFLDLAKPRHWQLERAEELIDAAIYDACDLISKEDARDERRACEAADELARTNPIAFGLRELTENARDDLNRYASDFDEPDESDVERLPSLPDFDVTDVDGQGDA